MNEQPISSPPANEAPQTDVIAQTPVGALTDDGGTLVAESDAQPLQDNSQVDVAQAASSALTAAPTSPELSALPPESVQPAAPAAPRALTPGAFLRGEIEVKRVISRGMTNLYEGVTGDYGATVPVLLAERDIASAAVPQTAPVPAPAAPVEPADVQAAAVQSAPAAISTPGDAAATAIASETGPDVRFVSAEATGQGTTVNQGAESGAFVEDVDALPTESVTQTAESTPFDSLLSAEPASPVATGSVPTPTESVTSGSEPAAVPEQPDYFSGTPIQGEVAPIPDNPPTQYVDAAGAAEQNFDTEAALQSPLFPPHERFEQEDREYLIFEQFDSKSLQDYRDAANDERLLAMLSAAAEGLRELAQRGLGADFTTETLRVDEEGQLRYLGFTRPASPDSALDQLRRLAAFLTKQVFAEAMTMRLDDEYSSLALTEEVKILARRLNPQDANAFRTINEAADAISAYVPKTRLRVEAALLSDVGQERELNEDAGMILTINRQAHLGTRQLDLYVVSDGMGGHEGGEVASDLTMNSLVRNLEAQTELNWNDNVAVRNALLQIIDAVNAEVVALTETPKYKGTRAKPGATLTFALRLGARVFVGNVGDSRTYKYADGKLERVTRDHSYVQNLIDRGEITEDEAFDHPDGSVITAHIGYPKLKQRDVFLRLFRPGETLLLVSDGVTDMLRDAEYLPHLQHDDPAQVCRSFVDAANEAGGFDNITVVCVKFS